jgi:hypothetical protein
MSDERYLKVKLNYEEGEWFLHIFDDASNDTLLYYPLVELVEDAVCDGIESDDRQHAFESLSCLSGEFSEMSGSIRGRIVSELLNADGLRNTGSTN